jgi:allantoicase
VGGDHSTPSFVTLADLASPRVGGKAIAASDDFFASKSNLLKPGPAVFVPGKYTARGKWMDGWESRRRRTPGYDWCVVALGMRGLVRGVDVDTSHFTGNYPSHCSIEALDALGPLPKTIWSMEGDPWVELLSTSPLAGDTHNLFAIDAPQPATHVRLNIFPDGGVARLRVYGEVSIDWDAVLRQNRLVDLASIRNGGLVLGASDMHFGSRDNMIMPGRAAYMGDGWETRRRRGPGYDWAVVRLAAPGIVSRIEIDTNHFKGNYPESASLEGCFAPGAPTRSLLQSNAAPSVSWREILRRTPLGPDRRHLFSKEIINSGPATHVRLNIFPDGGISRLRVYGHLADH